MYRCFEWVSDAKTILMIQGDEIKYSIVAYNNFGNKIPCDVNHKPCNYDHFNFPCVFVPRV